MFVNWWVWSESYNCLGWLKLPVGAVLSSATTANKNYKCSRDWKALRKTWELNFSTQVFFFSRCFPISRTRIPSFYSLASSRLWEPVVDTNSKVNPNLRLKVLGKIRGGGGGGGY